MSHFTGAHTVSFSQGRRNEVYVYQGYGKRGMVYRPSSGEWREVGVDAPGTKPGIEINTTPTYYVARIDIEEGGTGYNKPPLIEIDAPSSDGKQAKAIARIQGGAVSEIDVTDYGTKYTRTPCVRFKDLGSTGSGAATAIQLDDGGAPGDPKTGIVYWEILQQGAKYPCWPAGSVTGKGKEWACTLNASGGVGSGARVRITVGSDSSYAENSECNFGEDDNPPVKPSYRVEVDSFGQGYRPDEEVTVTIPFATQWIKIVSWGGVSGGPTNCGASSCPMILKGYPLGHPKCPDIRTINNASTYRARKIKQVQVTQPGTMYLQAPSCTLLPYPGAPTGTGFSIPAQTDCSGTISKVERPDDTKYLIPPQIEEPEVGGAKGLAIVRATLRGKYQCYYRFVDDSVPEEEGGPLYSNLSPVTEVDCGDAASQLTWSVGGASGKATAVELWRSSSNQATTLFRVAKLGGKDAFGSQADTLSDWELMDADREGFLAMPILLPNGELNANRFGVPPDNYAVGVMFQDRMWMGVDTTGKGPNTLRFSETDEPESMPDVNELIIQSNLRATDYLTALIPYAGALICCQARHSHRLTYVAQPLIDAAVFLLAYRGCLNQRCWDIYEGKIYAADDQGVYSLDAQGNVEGLSVGLDNFWSDEIDFSLREWFFVRVDRRANLLRVCVAVKGDGSKKYPTRQLVYSFDYKSWWEERFPVELTSGTDCRTTAGNMALVYGTSSGSMYQVNAGLTDVADKSIHEVTITNPGRGYKIPPKVSAVGGHGAEFEVGLNTDGQITSIMVQQPGTQYPGGSLVIDPPADGGVQATATYSVVSGKAPVAWSYKSGNYEFTTDSQDRKAGEVQSRQVSVVYQPTKTDCQLLLKTYYNGAKYPRSNVARRDRGTGFVHSEEVPAATLNMAQTPLQEAESHGVARALFAGRTLDDFMGSDRHVAIGLSGKQDDAGPVSLHVVDIYGCNGTKAD